MTITEVGDRIERLNRWGRVTSAGQYASLIVLGVQCVFDWFDGAIVAYGALLAFTAFDLLITRIVKRELRHAMATRPEDRYT